MKLKILTAKNFFVILVIVFLLASLYSGLLGGTVNTALWAVFALLAFGCIYKAFPNFWKYSFLLCGIYIFAGVGGSLLTTGSFRLIAIALLSEVIAIFAAHRLASTIIRLRERYGYSRLGFWFFALILFFIFSNISLLDWARWVVGKSSLVTYVFAEVALILLLVYILWVPETELKYMNICKFCNVRIKFESLVCPSCNSETKLAYCAKGEHWLVECKFCKALTIYGKEKCMNCKKKLPRKLECEFCNKAWSLSKWKRLEVMPAKRKSWQQLKKKL